jgi:transcription elongation factor GreA
MQVHDSVPLTKEAISAFEEELEYLRTTRRREVADLLRDSREMDDPEETEPGVVMAHEEQAFVEGRILEVEQTLARARVIDPTEGARLGRVVVGATVVVEDARGRELVYTVVSSAETDPSQGKVSDASPVGRALMNAAPGDTVTVEAPAGVQQLKVLALR